MAQGLAGVAHRLRASLALRPSRVARVTVAGALAADQEDLARASVLLWPALAAVMAGAVVQVALAQAVVPAAQGVQQVQQGVVAVVFKATAQTKKPT